MSNESKQSASRAKKEIEYEGTTYTSISAFCKEFGLSYPAVTSYLRKGLAVDDIVRRCKAVNVKKTNRQHREGAAKPTIAVEYDGVTYNSILEAAETLGISESTIHENIKKHKMSPNGAVELAVARAEERHPRIPGHRTPCTIDGIKYISQQDAMRAYDLPALTVYSRMKRDNISFEEAVLRGNRKKKRLKPLYSSFDPEEFSVVTGQQLSDGSTTLGNLLISLQKYKYKCSCYASMIPGENTYYIKVVDELLNNSGKFDVFVILREKTANLEFLVPELKVLNNLREEDKLGLFKKLNYYNATYLGAKIYFDETCCAIKASWSMSVKLKMQDTKAILTELFAFLGVCEEVVRDLGKEQVSTLELL